MGRSVAQFRLSGLTQASVLSSAQGFALQENCRIVDGSPNHITIARGSELWTGGRAMRVAAWDTSGGVNVMIEAWADVFPGGKYNANPRAILGFFARRGAWKLVSTFLARLGVTSPERLFRHD